MYVAIVPPKEESLSHMHKFAILSSHHLSAQLETETNANIAAIRITGNA